MPIHGDPPEVLEWHVLLHAELLLNVLPLRWDVEYCQAGPGYLASS